jgi:hypothetical protein
MQRRLLGIAFLLLNACATSKPPPPPIDWMEVPAAALEAICTNSIRGEGIGRQTPIFVVDHTQTLITPPSVSSLRRAFFGKTGEGLNEGVALAEKIRNEVHMVPVSLPTASASCTWRAMTRYDSAHDYDKMILQLSTPFRNPYAKNEYGLFARLSVGGQAAQWYWIPMEMPKGKLTVGRVIPLDIGEN